MQERGQLSLQMLKLFLFDGRVQKNLGPVIVDAW
jgi:hypothetical protein